MTSAAAPNSVTTATIAAAANLLTPKPPSPLMMCAQLLLAVHGVRGGVLLPRGDLHRQQMRGGGLDSMRHERHMPPRRAMCQREVVSLTASLMASAPICWVLQALVPRS